MSILILLITLANLILILLGLILQSSGQQYRFQANTVKTKRVLSLHFLGLRVWAEKRLKILKRIWREAITQLQRYIEGAAHDAN